MKRVLNRVINFRFSGVRVFNSVFGVENGTYSLDVDLTPPTVGVSASDTVQVKYPSSLFFSVVKTALK